MEKKLQDIDRLRKDSKKTVQILEAELLLRDNNDADASIDAKIMTQSEDAYIKIAEKIVQTSTNQLEDQNESKNRLKEKFTKFFIWFISIQYGFLALLLVGMAIFDFVELDTAIIMAYIGSVFVETLGAIILMITYAFNSQQEVKILEILNKVIANYQKFKK